MVFIIINLGNFHKIEEKTLENSISEIDIANTQNEIMLVTEPQKNSKANKNILNNFISDLERKFDMGIKGIRRMEETNDPNLQKKRLNVV